MDERNRVFLAKVAVALSSFAAAVAVGLNSSGVWHAPAGQKLVLTVALAGLALGSSVASAVGDYRARRSAQRRERVAFLLEALGFAVQDATQIDFRDLGLAAYVVERAPFRRQQRLTRLHRVRPRTAPGVSGVAWQPGKGVIGLCIVEGRDIGYDVAELDAALEGTTAETWEQLPADDRLGLRHDEWLSLREKFGVVVATPVVHERAGRSTTIGCVALDGPAGTLDVLFSDVVRAELQSAATSLERVVL